jgi:hypothetical protein
MDRFQSKEMMAKASLHQTAIGNLGPDTNRSRVLSRRDKAEQLRSLVASFSNMSLHVYLDAAIFFFE